MFLNGLKGEKRQELPAHKLKLFRICSESFGTFSGINWLYQTRVIINVMFTVSNRLQASMWQLNMTFISLPGRQVQLRSLNANFSANVYVCACVQVRMCAHMCVFM